MTINNGMQQFTIYTLVDITRTRQYRTESDKLTEKYQQQNFDMLIQTIGLRANPTFINDPDVIEDDSKYYELGGLFEGQNKIWVFTFFIEREGSFQEEDNPAGLLITDLNYVPIITNLTETANINPFFETKNHLFCNTRILSI